MKRIYIALTIILVPFVLSAQSGIAAGEKLVKAASEGVFIENKGQLSDQYDQPRPDVLFAAESKGLVYHLRNNGISYQQYRVDNWKEISNAKNPTADAQLVPDELTVYRTDINWIGTNTDFIVEKDEAIEGINHYYLAACPDGVHGVQSFKSVTYRNIYDGIDLKWYNKKGAMEYDFMVAPGKDYSQIKWKIAGAEQLSVSETGELVIKTPLGEIREQAPLAFQNNKKVEAKWLVANNTISFNIAEYDPTMPLLIDPVVRVWGTYYGAAGYDRGLSCFTDASSNVYLAGYTSSNSSLIATSGTHQTTLAGDDDGYLVKFDRAGTRQWATYYGGTGYDEVTGGAADASSNVYITGRSGSSTMATVGSHQDTYGGSTDAYLVKFNSGGVRQWATYYGGTANDEGYGCITDASLNVYLSGKTTSTSAIATTGTHQNTYGGGSADAFLVKFNSAGVRQWGTYYGGTSKDFSLDCVLDGTSNIYLAGETESTNAIATPGAHQTTIGGGSGDFFLAKFDNSGVQQWATYYGGSNSEFGINCAVDQASNIFFTGSTSSSSGIATAGSHDNIQSGNFDALLVKFNSSGVRQWGAFYGGTGADNGYSCSVDAFSNVYIGGNSNSSSGISTPGVHQGAHSGSGDGMLAKFDNNGVRQWGTYFGGTDIEVAYSCATDGLDVYLAGLTASGGNIASTGSHDNTFNGNFDGFLVKFHSCGFDTVTINPVACDAYLSPSGTYTWTSTGTYYDTIPTLTGCDSLITINLTVNTTPLIISANDGDTCDMGTVELTATANFGVLNWYAAPTGGSSLGTGNTYTTPTLSTTTPYYVSVTENGCTSARVGVNARVNTTPSVTTTSGGSVCDNGVVNLGATASAGILEWFAGATGGTGLGTGTSFATPSLSTTTTYYVEAAVNGCPSPRTAVTATVNITPSITATTAGSRCGTGIVNLGATASAGLINWYASATGGGTVGSGTSFNTPSISSTTTYYVTALQSGCASTPRTVVVATVTPIPVITSTASGSVCDSGTITMAAITSNGTVDWYTAATGGSSIASGTNFISPMINTTTTYYVDATDNGCISASRTAIDATVNHSTMSTINETACYEYTSPSGIQVYMASGTYMDTIQNMIGCDSMITINLTINEADTTVIRNGSTFNSNVSGASYQWLDCNDDYAAVAGATGQSFTPAVNGSYALAITENGCTDTSSCYTIDYVGIGETLLGGNMTIFPNPTKDRVNIYFDEPQTKVGVSLYNVLGQKVEFRNYGNVEKVNLEIPGMPGIYLLKISIDEKVYVSRIIKQ